MKLLVKACTKTFNQAVSARCPHCGQNAVFSMLGDFDLGIGDGFVCGQRTCPNRHCSGHIFIVLKNDRLLASYPQIRIDFERDNIPPKVLRVFDEAISCHSAGSYIAAAIMVRRTLEEICADRKAQGRDLKLRIADLRSKIVIPDDLLQAMDELRILGNDAAHIEAKDYETISHLEVSVAIDFTKEILKSLYQYGALLAKFRSLKKTDV